MDFDPVPTRRAVATRYGRIKLPQVALPRAVSCLSANDTWCRAPQRRA